MLMPVRCIFFSSQRVHPVFHVFCCIKNTLSFEGIWWNMSLSDTTSCCLDLPHSYSDGNSQRCLQMTTGQLRAAAEKPLPSALPFPPFSILNFLVIRADEAKVPLMTSPSGRSMIILHFPKSTVSRIGRKNLAGIPAAFRCWKCVLLLPRRPHLFYCMLMIWLPVGC